MGTPNREPQEYNRNIIGILTKDQGAPSGNARKDLFCVRICSEICGLQRGAVVRVMILGVWRFRSKIRVYGSRCSFLAGCNLLICSGCASNGQDFRKEL